MALIFFEAKNSGHDDRTASALLVFASYVQGLVDKQVLGMEALERLGELLDGPGTGAETAEFRRAGDPAHLCYLEKLQSIIGQPGFPRDEARGELRPIAARLRAEQVEREQSEDKTRWLGMADCQVCNARVPAMGVQVGRRGSPSGCCATCHVLACEHHGHRDGNVPEFICVQCDPNFAAACAAVLAQLAGGQGLTADLQETAAGYPRYTDVRPGDLAPRWLAPSVADFLARRPGYSRSTEFVTAFERSSVRLPPGSEVDPGPLYASWQQMPPDAAGLLHLAAFICVRFHLVEGHRVDPNLERFARTLSRGD
ncbi:hypothetical protein ACFQS1_38260 [Paractinoplanes rhizophilus]|uniref:Uncharacterized protein n=1 Tax=Paractinoplanes rhizophilus TaxID=1416877 RepID=A0ABW2I4P4_9ACTN